ncbi:DUF4304 domain-containing protein [Kribbella sp. NPDC051936]|uniref:DUF4304 domain-containing protein n=1 Tax=Kribbella sp. NPDC051936 TaxID=3154946 RepID=UPI00342C6F60
MAFLKRKKQRASDSPQTPPADERAPELFKSVLANRWAPALRESGFKASGRLFVLPDDRDWVMLGFQSSSSSNAEWVKFTINLLVVGKQAWDEARERSPHLSAKPSPNRIGQAPLFAAHRPPHPRRRSLVEAVRLAGHRTVGRRDLGGTSRRGSPKVAPGDDGSEPGTSRDLRGNQARQPLRHLTPAAETYSSDAIRALGLRRSTRGRVSQISRRKTPGDAGWALDALD